MENATTSPIQFRLPVGGILQNMRVRHNITAGNGNAIVYTLRVNNFVTALSVSLPTTTADGADLIDMIPALAGDLVDIEVTKALVVGIGPIDIIAALELAA